MRSADETTADSTATSVRRDRGERQEDGVESDEIWNGARRLRDCRAPVGKRTRHLECCPSLVLNATGSGKRDWRARTLT